MRGIKAGYASRGDPKDVGALARRVWTPSSGVDLLCHRASSCQLPAWVAFSKTRCQVTADGHAAELCTQVAAHGQKQEKA